MRTMDALIVSPECRYVRPDQEDSGPEEPLSYKEAKVFLDSIDAPFADEFHDRDESMFDLLDHVKQEFPGTTFRFSGNMLARDGDRYHGYLDGVYLQYDDVEDVDGFEEYMILRFKRRMDESEKDNRGICAFCDDRISLGRGMFRNPQTDEYLWAQPSEFVFHQDDNWGKYVSLWWDR